MKIAIIGSRGLPAKYGGFETFADKLSELLAEAGHEVTVIGEKGNSGEAEFMGLVKISESRFRKSTRPVLFYFDSLKRAISDNDLVLVCGVGGALFYPLLKKKDTVLVTNVDGLEHLRSKFSWIKKLYVRIAQYFAAIHSDILVTDSEAVADFWSKKLAYSESKIRVITYGADTARAFDSKYLLEYEIVENEYYLVVARLVPENNILEIITGYLKSGSAKKLLIVGGLENSQYVEKLKKMRGPGITFSDAIYDKDKLDSLRIGAFAYIHGHSVGGTNPSLLEAMACSCLCICHDNIFNREVNSKEQLYFRNAQELGECISKAEKLSAVELAQMKSSSLNRVVSNYSWEKIGKEYQQLFDEVYERKHRI